MWLFFEKQLRSKTCMSKWPLSSVPSHRSCVTEAWPRLDNSFFCCRPYFFMFVFTMLANTIFADIFCYTLLSDFGWDWIIVIGAVEAGVATVAVTAVSILMVRLSKTDHQVVGSLHEASQLCQCLWVIGWLDHCVSVSVSFQPVTVVVVVKQSPDGSRYSCTCCI